MGNEPIIPAGGGAPCLLRGTLIRTVNGEVPIEELKPGDELPCLHGTATIDTLIHWWGKEVPVLIRRGAMAPQVPVRDTYVTERHGIYVEGILIAAGNLINGNYIARSRTNAIKSFEYFNLKLDRHTVIYANGMGCESHYNEAQGEEPCLPRYRFNSRMMRAKAIMKRALGQLDVA